MKKIILALAFSASLTGFAEAQTSRNPCYTTGAQTTQGIPNCISVGTSTPLPVVTTTTTGAPLDVEGNVASAATDSGNPVKIGGVFNTSPPGVSTGQRVDAQSDANGNLRIRMTGSSTTGADGILNTNLTSSLLSSEGSGGVANRPFINAPYAFNGTTWDRNFTCPNSAVVNVTAGAGATEIIPLTASQVIRVCSIALTISATGTSTISYGTGTNCGTGNTALTGAMALTTATPFTMSSGNGSLLRTASANALCVTAVTGNVTGFITYAKY
jgi:hypothetical protein